MSEIVPIKLHAKLSASGSEKWMTCTPSAKMEEPFPDEQSIFSAEGTFAHAVFEQELNHYLGRPVDPLDSKDCEKYDSKELRDHVHSAVEKVIARILEAYTITKDPKILVEQKLDFSPWVPEGFGTGDVVIITDDLVEVMDLKYGKGILVDAIDNSQMRLYGLGAYNEMAHLYDIKRVRMTVLQPRLNNYPVEEMPISDLLIWATDKVIPKAKLAWAGEGDLVAGTHCSDCFCRARFQCPERAKIAYELAEQDFALKEPRLLTLEQLTSVLSKADMAIDWLNDVKAYALKQAERGEVVPGYKLVEGRSNRKYVDQDAVAERLLSAGIDEALIYEKSLLGITAMEKVLGKKEFARLLEELVVKPTGKPTLVPEGDRDRHCLQQHPLMQILCETVIRRDRMSTKEAVKDAATKVITGKVRLSYVNIFKPRAQEEGQDPKYSVCVLIPKSDKETLAKIKDAIEAAKAKNAEQWGGKIPAGLKLPLRDGDTDRDSPEYKGHWFINANSKQKPAVVGTERDIEGKLIPLGEGDVYSGCYARVSLNFFGYSAKGNKGVGAGLQNVQKVADGEALSGRSNADDDFSSSDDDFLS